jgi:hypothetical protein
MLDDLERHRNDMTAFSDRLPYVLDLLAGVTRMIGAESSGHRTPVFGAWWGGVDRSAQEAIQEMRNAELKELVSRTAAARWFVAVAWIFTGGALHERPVLETLRDYLQQVTALLEEAERKLAS